MFQSKPLPLSFWLRLLTRLDTDFVAQELHLRKLLESKLVSVDTAPIVLSQAEEARQEALACLAHLEGIQLLILDIASQVRKVSYQVGIPEIEQRLRGLRKMIALYDDNLRGLPRRLIAEQDLQYAQDQYNTLRNQGQGEMITADRVRLRGLVFDLPVLGVEEGQRFENMTRNLHTIVDTVDANLQYLLASTLVVVTVSEDLGMLLSHHAVETTRLANQVTETDVASATA